MGIEPIFSESGDKKSGDYPNKEPNLPVKRSARVLDTYKRIFGEQLGVDEELILDLGAGDATMAKEIAEQTDHRAKVIRLDKDYKNIQPELGLPVVASEATKLPIASNSLDRIVSLWMFPYLSREQGAQVFDEILRVLKPGAQAAIFPLLRFKKVDVDIAEKQKHTDNIATPSTLVLTKPSDYFDWSEDKKMQVIDELSNYVTYGRTLHHLVRWGMAVSIEALGTHRTIDAREKGVFNRLRDESK